MKPLRRVGAAGARVAPAEHAVRKAQWPCGGHAIRSRFHRRHRGIADNTAVIRRSHATCSFPSPAAARRPAAHALRGLRAAEPRSACSRGWRLRARRRTATPTAARRRTSARSPRRLGPGAARRLPALGRAAGRSRPTASPRRPQAGAWSRRATGRSAATTSTLADPAAHRSSRPPNRARCCEADRSPFRGGRHRAARLGRARPLAGRAATIFARLADAPRSTAWSAATSIRGWIARWATPAGRCAGCRARCRCCSTPHAA